MRLKKKTFYIYIKQWLLAPNSRDSQITRANLARRVTFLSKMALGECWRVRPVLTTRLGECRWVWRVLATRIFLKTAVLASASTRQNRRVLGKYSNSRASSHCLIYIFIFLWDFLSWETQRLILNSKYNYIFVGLNPKNLMKYCSILLDPDKLQKIMPNPT